MKSSYAKKVDANQAEIVKVLRKAGAVVKHVHQVAHLFDLLVFHQGKTYCVEIKDGNKAKSAQKLKPGEQQCKDDLESVGVPYLIVNCVEDALTMIDKYLKCCVCEVRHANSGYDLLFCEKCDGEI